MVFGVSLSSNQFRDPSQWENHARFLRKIAAGMTAPDDLGDVTTLADPAVVGDLVVR